MPDFESLEQIRDAVEQNGDILTLKMQEVRDAYGAGRLGVHVRDNIKKALAGLGMATYPEELPDWQEHEVRIYKQGSAAADLIDAVLHPSESHDHEIREAVSGDTQDVLDQIRELVCD